MILNPELLVSSLSSQSLSEEVETAGGSLEKVFLRKLDYYFRKVLPKDQKQLFGDNSCTIDHLYVLNEELQKPLLQIISEYRFRINMNYAFLVLGALGIRKIDYSYPFYGLKNGKEELLPSIDIKVPTIDGIPCPEFLCLGELTRLDLQYHRYALYIVRPKEKNPKGSKPRPVGLYLLAATYLIPDLLQKFSEVYGNAFSEGSLDFFCMNMAGYFSYMTDSVECSHLKKALELYKAQQLEQPVWPEKRIEDVEPVLQQLLVALRNEDREGSLDEEGRHYLLPFRENKDGEISQNSSNAQFHIYEPSPDWNSNATNNLGFITEAFLRALDH